MFNRPLHRIVLASAVLLSLAPNVDAGKAPPPNFRPARTVVEFVRLMKTDPNKVKFIRTIEDWNNYVFARTDPKHPLYSLTQEQVDEVTAGVVFDGGIAGMRYQVLADNLTVTQFRDVFAAVGIDIEGVIWADYNNKWCASRATCKTDLSAICTSNC